MKRIILGPLAAAAAVSFSTLALTSSVAQSDQQANNLHSNLAGMKAGASEVLIASCTLVCDQILIPGVTTA